MLQSRIHGPVALGLAGHVVEEAVLSMATGNRRRYPGSNTPSKTIFIGLENIH